MKKLLIALALLLMTTVTHAATVATSFTSVASGGTLFVRHLDSFTYDVSGTFVGTVVLERTQSAGATWEQVLTASAAASGTIYVETKGSKAATYRFRCSAYTSGTIVTDLSDTTAQVPQAKTFYNSLNQPVGSITETGLAANTLSVSGAQTFTGATTFSSTVSIPGGSGALRIGTSSAVTANNTDQVSNIYTVTDDGALGMSVINNQLLISGNAVFSGAGLLRNSLKRVITANTTDTSSTNYALGAQVLYDVPVGVTYTHSGSNGFGWLFVGGSSKTGTGTLTISSYSAIFTAADSTAISGRKTALRLGAPTGGVAGNAFIADGVAYSGDWFINYAGTSASTLGGALTVGSIIGTQTVPFLVKALAGDSNGLRISSSTVDSSVRIVNGYNASLALGVNGTDYLTIAATNGRVTLGEGLVINGEFMNLNGSGAAADNEIGSTLAADSLSLYGGLNKTSGAVLVLHGSAHASASIMQFKTANVQRGSISAAGLWTIGTAADTTTIHAINGATEPAAAAAATLLNGPTNTAGNPDVWIKINYNGVNYVMPAWTP